MVILLKRGQKKRFPREYKGYSIAISTFLPEKAIVEFQKIVGIRRAELAKLTGDYLVCDESGYPCVLVKNGKGRKVQLQRLNKPEDIEIVKHVRFTLKK